MNVLHVHWSSQPIIGGIERHLQSLLPELQKHISITLLSGKGEKNEYTIIDQKLLNSCHNDVSWLNTYLFNKDIIHIHNAHVVHPKLAIELLCLCKIHNCKVVHSIHNLRQNCPISRELIDLTDVHIVYSKYMQDCVLSEYNVHSDILPCYITIPYIPLSEQLPSSNLIVQPTRCTQWKGSDISIKALFELIEEGNDLQFIHGGKDRLLTDTNSFLSKLQPYLQKSSIQVINMSYEECSNAIISANTVLCPTIGMGIEGEPFGLSCFESLVQGKRIIATPSGNFKQMLEPYSGAKIIFDLSTASLKKALREVTCEKWTPSAKDLTYINSLRSWMKSGVLKQLDIYKKCL